MDWQPIETFPKEGEYLCYDPVADKFDVCEWLQLNPALGWVSAVQMDGEYGPSSDEFQGSRATHWARMERPKTDAPSGA